MLGKFCAILYKGYNFCDFLFPSRSEKGSTLKGENLLLLGANSFL